MNLLLGGAAAYGCALAGLYLLQESFIFPRAAAALPTYRLPPSAKRLVLDTADGNRIAGHLVRATTPSRGLLLGFGGNCWNAADFTCFLAARAPDLDIAVFHYRGYRPSTGGPSERAFFADAMLIHDALVRRLRPRKVFATGFSLGSGVAAYLARVRELDGLVLVTPFDSIQAIARQRYVWAPIGLLLKHPFHSIRYLKGVDVPVAVITAGQDRIVPKVRSDRLVRALRRPVMVEAIPGASHITIYDHESFDQALCRAFDLLEATSTARATSGAELAAGSDDDLELSWLQAG
jgi:pimeloyl-ACP methyl ester carboxylesterase